MTKIITAGNYLHKSKQIRPAVICAIFISLQALLKKISTIKSEALLIYSLIKQNIKSCNAKRRER